MHQLLPCPFCGGSAEYTTFEGEVEDGVVHCLQCRVVVLADRHEKGPSESPVDKWNRRVPPPKGD